MYILTKQEIESIRKAEKDTLQKKLYDAIKKRTVKNTQSEGLVQKHDTNVMEHICWSRVADAALIIAVENDAYTKKWLRKVILNLCRLSPEEWIGPWFRVKSYPLTGQLETSHLTLAVSVTLDLCPEIFTSEETDEIKKALYDKGLVACRRYVVSILTGQNHINNWFSVLLNGYGTASAILGHKEGVEEANQWLQYVNALYEKDSHGESLQYSNYTSIHFCHLMEVLIRWGIPLSELPLETPAGLIPWMATSFMYMKPLNGWGEYRIPRSINFADSASTFRPSGDVLMQCASLLKEALPRQSSLASYLFQETYADLDLPFDEGSEFGFFNNFSIHSVARANEIATGRSPYQVGLPLINTYQNGNIHIRDDWENTNFILGIQAGYQSLNVSGHRHGDLNSFMLSAFGERILIDPGHCCYRLRTQAFSTSSVAHNTWTFEKDGLEVSQKNVDRSFFVRKEPLAQLKTAAQYGEALVVSSDAAKAYGNLVKRAERTWVVFAPHIVYVIDRIESTEPIKVTTRFWGNNDNNALSVNVAAQNKLVFRRGNTALKLFSMGEEDLKLSFDWGYVHNVYHPQPNQLGQSNEGSALGYCFTSESGLKHIHVYPMAIETNVKITGWHIYKEQDGFIKVESPEKTFFKEIKAEWDKIIIKNELGEIIEYKE